MVFVHSLAFLAAVPFLRRVDAGPIPPAPNSRAVAEPRTVAHPDGNRLTRSWHRDDEGWLVCAWHLSSD